MAEKVKKYSKTTDKKESSSAKPSSCVKTSADRPAAKNRQKFEVKETYYNGIEIPEDEMWLYEPENKDLLESLEEGLKQKPTIYRGSFLKYLDKN